MILHTAVSTKGQARENMEGMTAKRYRDRGDQPGSHDAGATVDDDGFTIIKSRAKPRPITAPSPEPQEQEPTSPYHPDFAQIRSPSDILVQAGDGVLFWFSLSLLAHHSPKFAMINHETLWLRKGPFRSTSVLNVLAIDSPTFAFIAHILLLNYFAGQRAIRLEEPLIDIPPGVVDSRRWRSFETL